MEYLIPRYAAQTRRGIDLCLADALVVPALSLLYGGMDALGFLASTELRATRKTFISWADQYMAAFLQKKGIGGVDLYSARCGLLHTGQAPSELVDSGQARELWYRFRGESHVNLMTNTPKPAVLIDVEELIDGFGSAVEQFLQDIQRDPAVGSAADTKAASFFRPGLLFGP